MRVAAFDKQNALQWQSGRDEVKSFYAFYPLHLLALYVIKRWLGI